jgi:hypothetical protein
MLITRHCEHVKTNGHFCGSPAMRGRNYCHFHLGHIGRQLRVQRYASLGLPRPPLELPLLEDAASIQLALMQVTEALLDGTLDHRTAGLVLYSLQTASLNLRTMQKEAEADRDAGNAICNQYDSFEQDYELEDSCAELRVADAEEDEDSAPISAAASSSAGGSEDAGSADASSEIGSVSQPGATALVAEDGSGSLAPAPRQKKVLKLRDEKLEIPLMLTEEQYLQAKVTIFQYRMDHNIDAKDKAAKEIPQRAAISQKISLGARKPVASVTIQEAWQQLEAGN